MQRRTHTIINIELADKGVCTVKMTKSFRPPFSKGGAVEAAEASSPSAEGEISFFFAPTSCKEKAANKFMHFDEL